MSSSNAAGRIDLPSADELFDSPGLRAAQDFANARALDVLREWASTPEIKSIMAEAERIKAAEAAREG